MVCMSDSVGLVLDTNIVLDLCVYQNSQTLSLKQALKSQKIVMLMTQAMLNELNFVLQRSAVQVYLSKNDTNIEQVNEFIQSYSSLCEAPEAAPWRCKDKSDQMFIDLAWAQKVDLLSKDKAVLALNKKFKPNGIFIRSQFTDLAINKFDLT